MALPRISFSWKPTISGRERWRLGLFMLVPSKSGRHQKLRIMVRGLLLWLAGMATAAYLAAAGALYYWLDQRPFNLVTLADCVLAPVRWDEITRKRGDAYIAEGLAALEQRNWSEAVLKIQAGLARSPDHRVGREKLALFYVAAGQRERGLKLMLDGMKRSYPGRETMDLFFKLCLAGEDFDLCLEGYETALAKSGGAVERDRLWLIEQKTRVLMVAERFADALAWIDQQVQRSDLLLESRVVTLIGLKRYAEAHTALQEWEDGSGSVNGGTMRIGVRLAREEQDLAHMRVLLERMKARAPTDANPWIYAVVQEHLAGDASQAQRDLDTFFMRFETKPAAMKRLADPLLEIEAWDLLDQVESRARLLGQEPSGWTRLQVESSIRSGDYASALRALEAFDVPAEGDADARGAAFWKETQLALARHLATGETSSGEALLQLVRQAPLALSGLKRMAELNEQAGNLTTALNLMQVARMRFPGSKSVAGAVDRLSQEVSATEQVDVELPLVQDGTPVDLDIETMLGGAATVSTDERVLGSARVFLARCDELIEQQAWGEMENLMRDLRRERPTWMNSSTAELLTREIELNIGLRNWPALVTNVRFRLDGSLARALEIMNLVRRLDGSGERTAAERVLSEIERRQGDFPPARRQREDWAKQDEAAQEAAAAEEDTAADSGP